MKLAAPTLCALLATLSLAAQDAPPADPAGVRAELETMFERPAGTPISDPQKARLRAFCEQHESDDLGAYGYVGALKTYLVDRDAAGAMADAQRYVTAHGKPPIAEHATMLGRIFLGGALRARSIDEKVAAVESAARLYDDTSMLARLAPRYLQGLEPNDARRVRVAMVRGLLAGGHDDEAVDTVLASVYAGGVAPQRATAGRPAIPATPMTPMRPVRGAAGSTSRPAAADKDALTGKPAPALPVVDSLQAGEGTWSLASLRGKVVVLDFTATWCGPCRKVIPEMVKLNAEQAGDVAVVGVTRYYGRATDFDADNPNGLYRKELDQAEERSINERFLEHFGIEYPVIFTEADATRGGWGVTGIPSVFVIGRDGNVVGHAVGAGEAAHTKLMKLIEKAL